MCDESVRQQLVERVIALGQVCSVTASIDDLRRQCGINSSNTVFKEALGSAIHHGLLTRHRPPAAALYDDERPITITPGPHAPQAAARQMTPYSDSLRHYFVS